MAFIAGSVVGEAILDDGKWIKGTKNIQKSNKGLTGSMLKAQLAFKGIEIVTKALINIGKKAVKSFIAQEKAEKQLEAVLKSTKKAAGLTAKELKKLASGLQDVTTFGDETIIAAESLLLTFTKIGKDVFPDALETVLDMSEALDTGLKESSIQLGKALQDPIQGITALSRVGVQMSEVQKQQIKDFMAVNDIASAQKIILGELETQFGGSARAARDTFGGALKALENVQGDVMEELGQFVAIVGKDIVKALTKSAEKVRDFITSTEGIEKIGKIAAGAAAGFSVLKTIGGELFEVVKKQGTEIWSKLKSKMAEVTDKTGGTISVFNLLAVATKSASIVLTVLGKTIILIIDSIGDLIIAITNGAKTIGKFFQFLSGDATWEEVKAQAESVKDAFVNLGRNVKDNVADLVTSTIDQFKELPKGIKELNAQMEKDSTAAYTKTYGNIMKLTDKLGADLEDAAADRKKKQEKNLEDEGTSWANHLTKVLGKIAFVMSQVTKVYSDVFDIIIGIQEAELEALILNNEEKLISIEEDREARLEGIDDEAQREIDILTWKVEVGTLTQEEADVKIAEIEKKREDSKRKIINESDKKMEKQKEKNRKKEDAKAKQIFEANKINQIAMIWITAAIGIVGAWAQSISQLGPIAGTIFAAVLTAAILAVAIAQTVVISQQQYVPAKQMGGMAGGMTRVNESGGEIITLPDGSQVVPNDISRQIAKDTRGGGITFNISFRGATISDDMSLRKISEFVSDDIARKLELV